VQPTSQSRLGLELFVSCPSLTSALQMLMQDDGSDSYVNSMVAEAWSIQYRRQLCKSQSDILKITDVTLLHTDTRESRTGIASFLHQPIPVLDWRRTATKHCPNGRPVCPMLHMKSSHSTSFTCTLQRVHIKKRATDFFSNLYCSVPFPCIFPLPCLPFCPLF